MYIQEKRASKCWPANKLSPELLFLEPVWDSSCEYQFLLFVGFTWVRLVGMPGGYKRTHREVFYGVDMSVWGGLVFDLNLAAGQARLARMLMRRKLTIMARWHVSGDGVWANLYELSKVRVIVQKETSCGDCLLSWLLSYVYSLPSALFFLFFSAPHPPPTLQHLLDLDGLKPGSELWITLETLFS